MLIISNYTSILVAIIGVSGTLIPFLLTSFYNNVINPNIGFTVNLLDNGYLIVIKNHGSKTATNMSLDITLLSG